MNLQRQISSAMNRRKASDVSENSALDNATEENATPDVEAPHTGKHMERFEKYREKFSVPDTDSLVTSFSCALNNKGKLLQGRLYITQSAACFISRLKKNSPKQASFTNIKSIKKTGINTIKFDFNDPNIKDLNFTSFASRDKAFIALQKQKQLVSAKDKSQPKNQNHASSSHDLNVDPSIIEKTSSLKRTPGKLNIPQIFQEENDHTIQVTQDPAARGTGINGLEATQASDDILTTIKTTTTQPEPPTEPKQEPEPQPQPQLIKRVKKVPVDPEAGMLWAIDTDVFDQAYGVKFDSKKEIFRGTFDATVKTVLNVLFLDQNINFANKYATSRNHFNIDISDWQPGTEQDKNMRVRLLKTVKALTMKIGPKETRVVDLQHLSFKSDKGFRVESEGHNLDAPFGDYFRIETTWDFTPTSDNKTEVIIYAAVNFTTKTMLQSKIEGGAMAEVPKSANAWYEMADAELKSFLTAKANEFVEEIEEVWEKPNGPKSQAQIQASQPQNQSSQTKRVKLPLPDLEAGMTWTEDGDVYDKAYGTKFDSKTETYRGTFDASVKTVLNVLFLDPKVNFAHKYAKSRNHYDIDIGQWQRGANQDKNMRVRLLKTVKALTMKIGPKETRIEDLQHLSFTSDNGFRVESEGHNLDAPFGDYFRVETTWEFKPTPDGKTDVAIYAAVNFITKTMLQSKIEAGAMAETPKSAKAWFDFAEAELKNFKAAKLAEHIAQPQVEETPRRKKVKKAPVDPEAGMTWTEEGDPVDTTYGAKFDSKKECHTGTINASPKMCLNILFLDSKINFAEKYSKHRGHYNIKISEWKRGGERDKNLRVRMVSTMKPLTMKIGPKETRIEDIQHLSFTSDNGFIVESEAHNLDAPFGDCFRVETTWEFKPSSDGTKTNVTIYAVANFVQKTMMQGKIESGIMTEVPKSSKAWFDFAKAEIEGFKEKKLAENDDDSVDAQALHRASSGRSLTVSEKGGKPGKTVYDHLETTRVTVDKEIIQQTSSVVETIIGILLIILLVLVLILLVVALVKHIQMSIEVRRLERIVGQLMKRQMEMTSAMG